MRYMLMMHAPRGNGDWGVMNWKPEELKAHIEFMNDVQQGPQSLRPAGRRRGPRHALRQARIVRATSGGAPAVTDGPYPEAKEFLAGYWIVDVRARRGI